MSSDTLESLRRLYFDATEKTIGRDLARAIELFKQLETEEERERAAVFMDGLAQMRSEWAQRSARPTKRSRSSAPRPRS